MLADYVRQGANRLLPKVSLSRLVLQVVHGQHNHGEPLLGRFEALQAEIAQAQSFLQIQVIDTGQRR
jgi:hypothetical protein